MSTSPHILLITCSSGYGHVMAMKSIKTALESTLNSPIFHELDVIPYFYPVNRIISRIWDTGIRQDSQWAHWMPSTLALYETLYPYFFSGPLEKKLRSLMTEYPISQIIDTQPVFTPLILKTIAEAAETPVEYHKVLTDLPVNEQHPFFWGLKKRGEFKNINFFLHGAPPLTEVAAGDFWKNYCNIGLDQFKDTWAYPVHTAFKQVPKDLSRIVLDLPQELRAFCGFELDSAAITIPAEAEVATLALGSQGLEVIETYFNYILQKYSKQAQQNPYYFFIGCSRNQDLFNKLVQIAKQYGDKQALLKVIPMPMQPAENIAQLLWRSQHIFMRASGLSSLEQLAMQQAADAAGVVFNPTRYIHSHCKKSIPEHLKGSERENFLLAHSAGHEKNNAIYLKKYLNAQIIRPEFILE